MKKTLIKTSLIMLVTLSGNAIAHHTGDSEYYDVTIMGVGFQSSNSGFRFTIGDPDRPEAKNLFFISDEYTGEREKQLYSLVLSAYMSKQPVKLVTWGAATSSKYVKVRRFDVGTEM